MTKRKPNGECIYRPGLICFVEECDTCGWSEKVERNRKHIEPTMVNGLWTKIIKRRTEDAE